MASDPAVHGEDRNPNADPRIIKNISDIFQASKKAWEKEKKAREEELRAWEKKVDEAKVPFLRYRIDKMVPDISELRGEFGHFSDQFIPEETTIPSIARSQSGGIDEDNIVEFLEKVYISTGGSKGVKNLRSARAEALRDHLGFGVESFLDVEYVKKLLQTDGALDAQGRVMESRVIEFMNASDEATKKKTESLRDETAVRERGTVVIQAEIPFLHERRAALAGGTDQAQMATAAEKELMGARAQWLTNHQELLDSFLQPLTGGGAGSPAAWTTTPTGGDEHVASDPRYTPAAGESWQDYYYAAYHLAKHGGTEREKNLGRERAMVAAAKLGWPPPQFASGTPFAPGGLALVGEMGPELVNLPRGSQVIPQPRLGSEVTVNVTVHGSVVAERDLAQRIRQELIRTSRRTVDLGFN